MLLSTKSYTEMEAIKRFCSQRYICCDVFSETMQGIVFEVFSLEYKADELYTLIARHHQIKRSQGILNLTL